VEIKRRLHTSKETLHGLIGASLRGVQVVTKKCVPLLTNQSCARIFGFESPAGIMTLDSIADADRRFPWISLFQDGGTRAR
jgi:hypothetical protein